MPPSPCRSSGRVPSGRSRPAHARLDPGGGLFRRCRHDAGAVYPLLPPHRALTFRGAARDIHHRGCLQEEVEEQTESGGVRCDGGAADRDGAPLPSRGGGLRQAAARGPDRCRHGADRSRRTSRLAAGAVLRRASPCLFCCSSSSCRPASSSGFPATTTKTTDREWLGRAGAWLIAFSVRPALFSAIAVFGPVALYYAPVILASVGGAAGLVAALLGFSGKTPANQQEKEEGGAMAKAGNLASALTVPLFIAALLAVISLGTHVADSTVPRRRSQYGEVCAAGGAASAIHDHGADEGRSADAARPRRRRASASRRSRPSRTCRRFSKRAACRC